MIRQKRTATARSRSRSMAKRALLPCNAGPKPQAPRSIGLAFARRGLTETASPPISTIWSTLRSSEFCSGSQPRESLSQDQNTGTNLFGGRVLIGSMADAAAAGNKDHGRRAKLSHKKRIMVSAADHFP